MGCYVKGDMHASQSQEETLVANCYPYQDVSFVLPGLGSFEPELSCQSIWEAGQRRCVGVHARCILGAMHRSICWCRSCAAWEESSIHERRSI